jgi:hypothetical protein
MANFVSARLSKRGGLRRSFVYSLFFRLLAVPKMVRRPRSVKLEFGSCRSRTHVLCDGLLHVRDHAL